MQSRMSNPAMIIPEAMKALHALGASAEKSGLPAATIGLCQLRASQINGCSVCVDMHSRDLKRGGETDERLFALAAWRDAPYFTDAERAALALTEAVTRISDRPDPDKCLEPPQRRHQAGGRRVGEVCRGAGMGGEACLMGRHPNRQFVPEHISRVPSRFDPLQARVVPLVIQRVP